MTLSADSNAIINALSWFGRQHEIKSPEQWSAIRNKWMRDQGFGGIVDNGQLSNTIPIWWNSNAKFWFENEAVETMFVLRWS